MTASGAKRTLPKRRRELMLVHQAHHESASIAFEAGASYRAPRNNDFSLIVGPCGERVPLLGDGIRKTTAMRTTRAASDAKRGTVIGSDRLTHCAANMRRTTASRIMLISQGRFENASSRSDDPSFLLHGRLGRFGRGAAPYRASFRRAQKLWSRPRIPAAATHRN